MEYKGRILVVDDEDRFRSTFSRLLREKGGYDVDTAAGGLEALNKLAAREFDVVLLDLRMPGMTGEETFNEISMQGFEVETVCLTGHASINDATRLMRRGVFDYLLKPADMKEIFNTVDRALERKRLRRGEIGIGELLEPPST